MPEILGIDVEKIDAEKVELCLDDFGFICVEARRWWLSEYGRCSVLINSTSIREFLTGPSFCHWLFEALDYLCDDHPLSKSYLKNVKPISSDFEEEIEEVSAKIRYWCTVEVVLEAEEIEYLERVFKVLCMHRTGNENNK